MPLGKSLGNILGDYFGEESVNLNQENPQKSKEEQKTLTREIEISKIQLSQFQTRTNFDFEKIQSLAENIKENGLIHPIVVVTKKSENQISFILLAGERRLRACKLLGFKEILAIVKPSESLTEKQQAMISAMENLQREDLSPIELAHTFKMLMKTQDLDELAIAKLLDSSVQYIKNHLRLLTLIKPVQEALLNRTIGEGQARHLVGLSENNQLEILTKIIENDLTVKEIIEILKKPRLEKMPTIKSKFHNLPTETIQRANRFAQSFPNSKLKCEGDSDKGKIIISWDITGKSKHTKS